MGRGGYNGAGTVIGPQDHSWFGNGPVVASTNGQGGEPKPKKPLDAEADARISQLKRDVQAQLLAARGAVRLYEECRQELIRLLAEYGLPRDSYPEAERAPLLD